jgi:ADP-heptose:LPS heptosyltransferase
MPNPVDLTEGAEDMKIVDVSEFMNDFEDTAAIIKGMDLIISIDTAVVHLAGALGHPTWALLAWNADWRWKATGETTEWYSSVRLFRQPKENDWNTVFTTVANRIKNDYLLQNKQQQL